jgi:mono/diheme cytochrome c family protein
MCHGQAGKGDGILAAYFKAANQKPPADYTAESVQARSDGELFAIISNGLGQMPPFRDLLSYEDRWSLVYQIRTFQGK